MIVISPYTTSKIRFLSLSHIDDYRLFLLPEKYKNAEDSENNIATCCSKIMKKIINLSSRRPGIRKGL